MDDEIAKEFEKRDRFRRHEQQSRTPAERMAACWRVQAISRRILLSSPEGYAEFLRRNFRERAARDDDANRIG